MSKIHAFLVQARERGLNDSQVLAKLTESGWEEEKAKALLEGSDLVAPSPIEADESELVAMPVASAPVSVMAPHEDKPPLAVVQRYTTRGLEYGIQFLALGIGAVSLGVLLHDLANKSLDPNYGSETWVAMAGAAAIVSIPIFAILFLRLKRAEKTTPELRRDSSRRKWVQLSLLVSFLWGIQVIIRYLYDLLAGHETVTNNYSYCAAYESAASCGVDSISGGAYTALQLIHLTVTLVIAGGIFAYYWLDEHKKDMS